MKRFVRNEMLMLLGMLILAGGCSTVTDQVSVYPVVLRFPNEPRRLTSVADLVDGQEFGRALSFAWSVEERKNPSVRDLAALGRAQVAGGRFDDARKTLNDALSMNPPRNSVADINWDLSQAAYLQNDFAGALAHAREAEANGLQIKDWHLALLEELAKEPHVVEISSETSGYIPMRFGNPAIPRVDAKVNGQDTVEAIIDTGAVFTTVAESVAEKNGVRRLGVNGILLGLLGESITVSYGMVDSLEIGNVAIANVPVAIISDESLSFFIARKSRFNMSLLLGSNLLKEFRIELDYRREQIKLTRLSLERTERPNLDQNLFFIEYRPMIHAAIDKRGWYLFLLDTGSEVTFLNHTTIQNTSLRHWSKLNRAMLQGLGGATKHGTNLQDVEITVAGWGGRFSTIPLYATEPPAFGILGENFLRHFRVVIDFGKMRIDLLEGE